MAFETEGVSYLLSLKRSTAATGGGAAAASPAQSSTTAGNGVQPRGIEKRRSPRYKCEGKAEIRQDGANVRTWATFTDISIHGCYLEAPSVYPVHTLLHLKLEASGVSFEAKGEVRVSYPALGMGIAFVEISEEHQGRLRELIAMLMRHVSVIGPGIAAPQTALHPVENVPLIFDPKVALQALIEYFENRQMLLREDFLRLLKKSQSRA